MKTHNYILMLLCWLLPMHIQAQHAARSSGWFEVNGTVNGEDGEEIVMARDFYGDNISLAKDTIRNGQFHFKVPVQQLTIVYIVITKDRMINSHTLIMEPARITYAQGPTGIPIIRGGKYNPLLLAYESNQDFIAADKELKAEQQTPPDAADTLKQWRTLQWFLKKDSIRSNSQLAIMKGKDPAAAVMAAILLELQPDREKAMAVVDKYAPQLGENSFIIRHARRLNASQEKAIAMRLGNMVGQGMYDFSAPDLNKDSLRLSKVVLTHKYTLLQFWASWCVPCREEIPTMKKIYEGSSQKGLAVISFSLDADHTSWLKASEQEHIPWSNISDLKATASPVVRNYGISSIPANVIIDQQGKVIAANLVGKALEEKIKSLLP